MREYKIFIDENFPPQLARGLHILQEPQNAKEGVKIDVFSIKDYFGEGVKDEEWIPKVGEMKGVVITQDVQIRHVKHQRQLFIENGVGILFFTPPSKTGFLYWEIVKQLIKRWDKIKDIARKKKPPFAYRCSANSEFQEINIDNN